MGSPREIVGGGGCNEDGGAEKPLEGGPLVLFGVFVHVGFMNERVFFREDYNIP